MTKRSIMVVGLNLPWPDAEFVRIDSKRSLLDGDLIVVHPTFLDTFEATDSFQGKPSYYESVSFEIRECMKHWRNEITSAYNAGKTIITFLVDQEEFYIDTGKRTYSGTGRNQKTTRIMELVNNYLVIPYILDEARNANGARFKRGPKLKPIESYWKTMESMSEYRIVFAAGKTTSLLTTLDGSKTVSAYVRAKGTLIFVPDFVYPNEDLTAKNEKKETVWTTTAIDLAKRLQAAFVSIDNECRGDNSVTETPIWAKENSFRLPDEAIFEASISAASEEIAELQKKHTIMLDELEKYTEPKSLLFENGKKLEKAVRESLVEMGFEVSTYTNGDSEFDAVFSADGKRYLGEIEGKDDRPINVDKISQLERNIGEDLARDEVDEPAIGVLFGNAFRLKSPDERDAFFTEKVVKSAARTGSRLVRTTDLFHVVKELRKNKSPDVAKTLRQAIHDQAGKIVVFPLSPTAAEMQPTESGTELNTPESLSWI